MDGDSDTTDDDAPAAAPPPRAPPADGASSAGGRGARDALGCLVFDASFEAANLGEVTQVTPCEYELRVRPDTRNARHRLWFWFGVVGGAKAGQRVLLSVVNFNKGKSLYTEGMTPLVRSLPSRPAWERLPASSVFYYRSPRHRGGRSHSGRRG